MNDVYYDVLSACYRWQILIKLWHFHKNNNSTKNIAQYRWKNVLLSYHSNRLKMHEINERNSGTIIIMCIHCDSIKYDNYSLCRSNIVLDENVCALVRVWIDAYAMGWGAFELNQRWKYSKSIIHWCQSF